MAVIKDAVSDAVKDAVSQVVSERSGQGYMSHEFGGTGPFDYTRASQLIQSQENGVGRFDSNDSIWPRLGGGIRIEPAATNLIKHTVVLTNAVWLRDGAATVTAKSGKIDPIGLTNTYQITASTDTDYVYQYSDTYTAGRDITLSVFVKKNTSTKCRLTAWDSVSGEGGELKFNFDDPESSEFNPYVTTGSWQYEDWDQGWYRIALRVDGLAATSMALIVGAAFDYSVDNYYAYPQVEQSSAMSSYIETNSTTMTRAKGFLSGELPPIEDPSEFYFTARIKVRLNRDLADLISWSQMLRLSAQGGPNNTQFLIHNNGGNLEFLFESGGIGGGLTMLNTPAFVKGDVVDIIIGTQNSPAAFPRVYQFMYVNGVVTPSAYSNGSIVTMDAITHVQLGETLNNNHYGRFDVTLLEFEYWNREVTGQELSVLLAKTLPDPYVAIFDTPGQDVPAPLVFSRSTTSTVADPVTGVITELAIDTPDITPEGILMEPERTNLIPYSNKFNEWTATAVNTGSADLDHTDVPYDIWDIVPRPTVPNGARWLGTTTAVINTYPYCMSCVVKIIPGSTDYFQIAPSTAFDSGNRYASFDLINGVVASQSADVYGSIEALPNDWYRCTLITQATQDNAAGRFVIAIVEDPTERLDSIAYDENRVQGVYISHAQWEVSWFPTSFIPTVGATVTRAVDICEGILDDSTNWVTGGIAEGVTMHTVCTHTMGWYGKSFSQVTLQGRTSWNATDYSRTYDGGDSGIQARSVAAGSAVQANASAADLGSQPYYNGRQIDSRWSSSALQDSGRAYHQVLDDGYAGKGLTAYGTRGNFSEKLQVLILGELYGSASGAPKTSKSFRCKKINLWPVAMSTSQLRLLTND